VDVIMKIIIMKIMFFTPRDHFLASHSC